MIESQDAVAAQITFVDVEPSDSSNDIERADFLTFRDGKIARWHVYIDLPAV